MDRSAKTGDLIERGKALHRQGRLAEAAALYQEVLAVDPGNADALHLLGVIANQRGDHAKAAVLIRQALKYRPTGEHFHSNLGLALMGLGIMRARKSVFSKNWPCTRPASPAMSIWGPC